MILFDRHIKGDKIIRSRFHYRFFQRRSSIFIVIAIFVSIISLFYIKTIYSSNETNSIFLNRFPHCNLCNAIISKVRESTERDLVLLFSTDRFERIELLVRSLRSVGCIAKIVVLVPFNSTLPTNLSNCGVDFVEIASISSRLERSPHKMRWEWYYQYLSEHRNEYNRILHTDAFDTFAQFDPFSKNIRNDTLYAVSEGTKIKNCIFNSKWLEACYDHSILEELGNKDILCSGTVIGGAEQFFKLVETMVKMIGWDDCWSKAHDQPVFNYVIYKNHVLSTNIRILGCQSDFVTMEKCYNGIKPIIYKNKLLSPLPSGYPAFVHQYNRFETVDNHFQKICNVTIRRKRKKKS